MPSQAVEHPAVAHASLEMLRPVPQRVAEEALGFRKLGTFRIDRGRLSLRVADRLGRRLQRCRSEQLMQHAAAEVHRRVSGEQLPPPGEMVLGGRGLTHPKQICRRVQIPGVNTRVGCGIRCDAVEKRAPEVPVHADVPYPHPSAVTHDIGGLLRGGSPNSVVGNKPADIGVQRRSAEKDSVRSRHVGFGKGAGMPLRLGDDGLELWP